VGAQSAIAERCGRLPSLFEIPLALSMLDVGGPAGGAAALLFAGPATNLPSLIVIGRYNSWKVAASLAVLVWGIRSSRRSLAPLGLKTWEQFGNLSRREPPQTMINQELKLASVSRITANRRYPAFTVRISPEKS
jgi:hypothetical protein